jgi:hypothetical protein
VMEDVGAIGLLESLWVAIGYVPSLASGKLSSKSVINYKYVLGMNL